MSSEAPAVPLARKRALPRIRLDRYGLPLLLAAVCLVFASLHPETFATSANWSVIGASVSVVAVAALAFMVPLTAGEFDLSVGSIALAASIVVAGAMSRHGLPLAAALVLGVAAGALAGLVNGLLVARAHVNSLIATLGMATVLGGLVLWYTDGLTIANGISGALTSLGVDKLLGVPALVICLALVAAVVAWLLELTAYGRSLRAVGSSREAARLAGVDVRRTVELSFVTSGALAGVAGILLVAQNGNGNPQAGGIAFLLPAVAGAFLGATTIRPGRFNVAGTLIGLLFVAVVVNGLSLSGVDPWVEQVFTGGALVVAVALSEAVLRKRGRR